MTRLCDWKDYRPGGRGTCDQPAAYVAEYGECDSCGPNPCSGAYICVEHAAVERGRAGLVDLVQLRSLASTT